ncbi:MAG: hypothetical protein SFV32_04570 [Opitutaceae bacterium]|nr:hypothetical protein [Opitutaceae bacterium]
MALFAAGLRYDLIRAYPYPDGYAHDPSRLWWVNSEGQHLLKHVYPIRQLELKSVDGSVFFDTGDFGVLNDLGQVSFPRQVASTAERFEIVLWNKGEVTRLFPESLFADQDPYPRVYAMNNRGHIYVRYNFFPWLYHDGKYTRIKTLESVGTDAYPYRINNSSVMAGHGWNEAIGGDIAIGGYRAMLWTEFGSVVQDLGTFGGKVSFAFGLNDAGNVVGRAETPRVSATQRGVHLPFIFTSGKMIQVKFPAPIVYEGSGAWDATGINGYNVVVANGDFPFVWRAGRSTYIRSYPSPDGESFNLWTGDPLPIQIDDDGNVYGEVPRAGVSFLTPRMVEGATQGHLVNVSLRGKTGSGERTLIAGFTISGGTGQVVVRGVGPALESFNIIKFAADPNIRFHRDSSLVAEYDDWGNATALPQLVAASQRVGGFALADDSKDAAFVADLEAGSYTAHVNAKGTDGVALAEIYDANAVGSSGGHVTNLSGRLFVGTGEEIGIAGFVIAGDTPCRVLIRAIGPGLAAHGITEYLKDPNLWLHGSDGEAVLGNDDWGTADGYPLLTKKSKEVGAFALQDGSKDAVILAELEPGNYSVHVSGKNSETGVALIELYEIPWVIPK